jgi:translation elongation factor EF-1beta
MINIVRLQSQEKKEKICDVIMSQINELQDSIKGKGQLLYLSKRIKHKDVSLFIHTKDPGVLGDFIAERLNNVENITDIWVINMIKPVFFPLPKDTKGMKRFTITLKVFPKKLKDVYQNIANATLPESLKMAYIAYTFHLFGDSIQFSILADSEEALNKYLAEEVKKLPGVVKTTINEIERTRPLVSYDEWKQYSSTHGIVPAWDEELMINQFQK